MDMIQTTNIMKFVYCSAFNIAKFFLGVSKLLSNNFVNIPLFNNCNVFNNFNLYRVNYN